jgi:flagella basal body P-ring formation protein FlgA
MKRLLLASAMFLAASVGAFADQLPASLRSAVSVEGDTVRLGDLWDNLGDKADVVIAPAPQPGKRVTADARWLAAVAQNYGVNWRPANMFESAVIERASQTVDIKLVESELREALAMEGVTGSFEMEISNRAALNMQLPAGNGPVGVAVRDVAWDQRAQRFTATVEAPAGAPNAQRQRIAGRVFFIARVPVMSRTLSRGEVIGERDIEWVETRAEAVRRDIVTDIRQVIGQEPRQQLRQGSPIRLSDVQRPVLVGRNATVTMTVKTPFMKLATQGRAVDEGGKGDVIRVTNVNSKRVVEAIVDGPNSVVVVPNGAVALAN